MAGSPAFPARASRVIYEGAIKNPRSFKLRKRGFNFCFSGYSIRYCIHKSGLYTQPSSLYSSLTFTHEPLTSRTLKE